MRQPRSCNVLRRHVLSMLSGGSKSVDSGSGRAQLRVVYGAGLTPIGVASRRKPVTLPPFGSAQRSR